MDDLEFNSKQEASKFVIDLYKKFYKENQTNRHFSERKFSQKINISQSSLNSLRNSTKKELDPELAVKVLRGIGQPDVIEPVLSVLLPESHEEIKYREFISKENHCTNIERKGYGQFAEYFVSPPYALILALVFSGSKTTVEDVNNVLGKGAVLLQDLVKEDILTVSNGIVSPSEKVSKFLNKGKVHLNMAGALKHFVFLTGLVNSYRVENDEEPAYCRTHLATYHEEDIPKIIEIKARAEREILSLSEKNPGGNLKMGIASLMVFLHDAMNNKEMVDLKDVNKDTADAIEKNNNREILQ